MADSTTPTPPKLKRAPTHFVALRVDDPLLAPALARVQVQVAAHFPELKACLIPPPRFHLTLGVLAVENGDEEAAALLARFRGAAPALWARHLLLAPAPGATTHHHHHHHHPPFTLAFDGLASFLDGRGELRVLYAKVEEGEERRRLCEFVRGLRGALGAAVVQEEGEGSGGFTPHATLFKTSKDRGAVAEANKLNRLSPAQRRLEQYIFGQLGLEHKRLGSQVVGRLELLSMEGAGDYYRVIGAVTAAEASAAAAAASLPSPPPPLPPPATTDAAALPRRASRQQRRGQSTTLSTPPAVVAVGVFSLFSKWVDRNGDPIPLLLKQEQQPNDIADADTDNPLPKRPPRRARTSALAGATADGGLATAVAQLLSLQEAKEGTGSSPQTEPSIEQEDSGPSEWVFLYDKGMGLGRACLPRDCHRVAFSVAARADGWCLAFNGPGGKENLVPRSSATDQPVWGVLHYLSPKQSRHLAQAQHAQGMRPLVIQVEYRGQGQQVGRGGGDSSSLLVEATTYVCSRVIRGSMHWGAQYSIFSHALPPADRHLAALLDAARYWGLDRGYQQHLSSLPVVPYAERTREYYDAQDNPVLVALSRGQATRAGGGGGSGGQAPSKPAQTADRNAGGKSKAPSSATAAAGTGPEPSGGGGRRARGRLQHKWL